MGVWETYFSRVIQGDISRMLRTNLIVITNTRDVIIAAVLSGVWGEKGTI